MIITLSSLKWWALKKIWDKGLLYKGFKIVPYCPRCGTPLSAQEVAQGYKDVKERSAIVRFQSERRRCIHPCMDNHTLTLPSNIALCVNPEEDYAKVKCADGYTYYMACALLDTILGNLQKKTNRHTKFWKLTKEKIWNTKNMNRFTSVHMTAQQNRKRKHSLLPVMIM